MNSKIFWPLANTLGFAAVITVNALANILPINGMNTGQISALYPSLFTPAGITFGIWSVIYLLLLGFVIIQWGTLRQQLWFPEFSKWFLISCAANAAWILVWHYLLPGWSLIVMLVLWFSLSRIFLLLRGAVELRVWLQRFSQTAFSVYFAWICVATIANTSCLLLHWQWSGYPLTGTTWTIVMILVAAVLAAGMTWKYLALSFTLVVGWAILGIYWRWQSAPESVLANVSLLTLVVLFAQGVLFIAINRKKLATAA
ncbi:MAG: hypothetical protein ACK5DD_10585 [Cyclobacteriaceae bacterium]|jgi:benzodiazapine receptor